MGRRLFLGGLITMLLMGYGVAGCSNTPPCPTGLTGLNVPSGWPQSTWTACGDKAGKRMYLSNISGGSLLVWPQSKGATLKVQKTSPDNASPESGSEVPRDVADDALAQPSRHPLPDPQRRSIPAGWVYLGPGQEVLVKSRVAGGTGVTVSTDYYATVEWTLAQAADAWAASKLKSALGVTPSPRASALSCASDLQVTNTQVNSHPDPGELVHDTMLSADDCASLLHAFAPDELPVKSAQEVESFSEQFAEKLPPDVWDGLIHGAIQLLHDR